jgi:hypothetical protein
MQIERVFHRKPETLWLSCSSKLTAAKLQSTQKFLFLDFVRWYSFYFHKKHYWKPNAVSVPRFDRKNNKQCCWVWSAIVSSRDKLKVEAGCIFKICKTRLFRKFHLNLWSIMKSDNSIPNWLEKPGYASTDRHLKNQGWASVEEKHWSTTPVVLISEFP